MLLFLCYRGFIIKTNESKVKIFLFSQEKVLANFLFRKQQHYSSKSFKWNLFMHVKIYVKTVCKNVSLLCCTSKWVHCMFITFINLNSKYVFMHNKIPRVNSRSFYSLSCTESTTKRRQKNRKKDEKNFISRTTTSFFIATSNKKLSWQIYYVSCIQHRIEYILNFIFFYSRSSTQVMFYPPGKTGGDKVSPGQDLHFK